MHGDQDKLLQAEVAWLRQRAPFRELAPEFLSPLLSRASLGFFPRGSDILHPDTAGPAGSLFILKRGQAVLKQPIPGGGAEELVALEAGAVFPLQSVLTERKPHRIVSAVEDCHCWILDQGDGPLLVAEPAVLQYMLAMEWSAQERILLRLADATQARRVAEQVLCLSLGSAIKAKPVTMSREGSVGEALRLMLGEGVGSVVIVEGDAPVGIVTGSDLLRRVFGAGLTGDCAIAAAMSSPAFVMPDSTTVAEAALEMGTHSIRHLVVVNGEHQTVGVVSERDLFELQRLGLRQVTEPIESADSVEEIISAAERIRQLGRTMLHQGMGAAQLTRLVSSFNDRITHRLIELLKTEAVSGVDFCWLAFGSEGRQEQTFSTDQDNGVIFRPGAGDDAETIRAALIEFAGRVNAALDQCGFPLCDGGIMAMNPKWCLTQGEWQKRFTDWIRTPSPEALLNASIFFDFRALYGNALLAEALRDHLFSLSRENTIFLRMMSQNALEVTPPVGMFSRFATDGGEFSGTIDVKKQGARLFVDGARILALASGVRATSTEQRLRLGGQRMKRSSGAVEAEISAFHFLQGLRLRLPADHPPRAHAHANRLDPYSLHEFDQRTLREAFRQAQHLQERIKLDFGP
jgi:CBS domain-containing protein